MDPNLSGDNDLDPSLRHTEPAFNPKLNRPERRRTTERRHHTVGQLPPLSWRQGSLKARRSGLKGLRATIGQSHAKPTRAPVREFQGHGRRDTHLKHGTRETKDTDLRSGLGKEQHAIHRKQQQQQQRKAKRHVSQRPGERTEEAQRHQECDRSN